MLSPQDQVRTVWVAFALAALGYDIYAVGKGVFVLAMRGFKPVYLERRRTPIRFWFCVFAFAVFSAAFFGAAWYGAV
jgi:hypothetical protein